MKKLTGPLAVLMLAGCASPATQTTPTTPEAPAEMQAVEAPRRLAMAADADTEQIIVRFKPGKDREKVGKGHAGRQFGLERARVFKVKDAAEREALLAELKRDPAVEYAEPDYPMQAFATVNDPSLSSQWAIPKMAVPAAWDVTRGGPLVAVVDTGVAYNHPDLTGQIVKGYDYANSDNDPLDDQGHGSHCAGVIAALTNNGVGVAGVAHGSKVLAIKVLGSDGSGSTSGISQGILSAVNSGAKVISLSLGGTQSSSTMQNAVNQALNAGVVVVAAAGNDGNTTKTYPAAYPGVIAVGASTKTDTRASFSQYGDWISIAAPGEQIYSTLQSGYGYMSGTSMATPQVAAVAALLLAKNPTWTPAQVKNALVTTGDPVTGFESAPSVKRVNALKALGVTTSPSPSTSPSTSPTPAPTPTPTPVATPTPAPAGDTTAPTISGVSLYSLTSYSTTIGWTTNEASDTQVLYGYTTGLGYATSLNTSRVTAHKAYVGNLRRGSRVYFRVRSRDAAGNLATSGLYYFTTRYY